MEKSAVIFMIMVVLISKSGFSQQGKSILKDTINIDEVIITGSETSVNRNNVPQTVSVVSKEKIENSSESALLLLADLICIFDLLQTMQISEPIFLIRTKI
jgi:outer membrane cobalamin receptor